MKTKVRCLFHFAANEDEDCHSVELIYLFLYYNLTVKLKFYGGTYLACFCQDLKASGCHVIYLSKIKRMVFYKFYRMKV